MSSTETSTSSADSVSTTSAGMDTGSELKAKEVRPAPTDDMWHLAGPEATEDAFVTATCELIALCKRKLPQQEISVHVGATGYLEPGSESEIAAAETPTQRDRAKAELEPGRAWCFDRLGRFAALVDDFFLFQRGTASPLLMRATIRAGGQIYGTRSLRPTDIGELETKLK